MAVEAMHLASPTQSYTKMAFGKKTKSIEELNFETAYPRESGSVAGATNLRPNSTSSSDKSSSSSLLEFSLIERSEQAVEQLVTSRKQLEDEIEVLIGSIVASVVLICSNL